MRIDNGDPHQPTEPVKWLWKFIDGARTAGELYGRALAVIAAEQHASRLAVPQSQRTPAVTWNSHQNKAAKALTKLAKAAKLDRPALQACPHGQRGGHELRVLLAAASWDQPKM